MKVYINGEYFDKDNAKISVFDHGLLYGDGIFEGIRLYNKCIFKLDEHLERLGRSAKAIMLSLPMTLTEIGNAVVETCRANQLVDGYIRLVVTRGKGSLGLSPSSCSNPQVIIITDKIQLYPIEAYEVGLKVITVPTRRTSCAAFSSSIKSLNYLNNILAKIEAGSVGFSEAIMLNESGYVAECSGDNIFIVSKGVLYTPHTSDGALKGITREVVKEVAEKLNIEVKVVNLTRYDIWNADECFFTGTAAEIVPVIEVDARKIGTGKPGLITSKCLKVFREKVTLEGRMI